MNFKEALNAALAIATALCAVGAVQAADDLLSDINVLSAVQLAKGQFETSAEHAARTRAAFELFAGRTYTLALRPKELAEDDAEAFRYDADTETLRVALPSLRPFAVFSQTGGKTAIGWLRYSFVRVGVPKVQVSTYSARNGLGQEAIIRKTETTEKGIAMLASGYPFADADNRSKPEVFTFKLPREGAKELFANGQILLKIESVTSAVQDLLITGRIPERLGSPLIADKDESKPTMANPIHSTDERQLLPVRLVSLTIVNGRNDVLFRADAAPWSVGPR